MAAVVTPNATGPVGKSQKKVTALLKKSGPNAKLSAKKRKKSGKRSEQPKRKSQKRKNKQKYPSADGKMKIALFGGTFDPPHNGHALVADTLIKNELVDEIWFVPVFKHPWADRYQKQLSSYEDRVAMLELMLQDKPSQRLAHFKEISFTYDTLQFFASKHPEHSFFWLMGSEYLEKFADFLVDHPQLMEYPFLIYPRAGYDLRPVYGNMLVLEDMPTIKVSSTQVRQFIGQGQSATKLVPATVLAYIKGQQLY